MPDGNAAAQRVLGIAKVFRICGYDVRFCGLSPNGTEEGFVEDFEYKNFTYPRGGMAWLRYLTGRDYAISEIKAYKPDVVILYNHPALAIEHIAKYCNRHGIKILADITEWYEPEGNLIFKVIKGFDTNRRMNYSHLKLDGLICISKYLADFYKSKGAKVLEIPPLVDVEQAKWHQSNEFHQDEIRMVYAGSPGFSKDRLDLILQALDEIVPDIDSPLRFDVIGITAEQYQKTWSDDLQRRYVTFNGRRPHEEVIKKLLEADFQIFLRPDNLPNRAGFPTKFVETITSRTLPITNISSNLAQYLIDGENGFVIKGLDKEAIKEALVNLRISRSDLNRIKEKIDIATFDFRNFKTATEEFIGNL